MVVVLVEETEVAEVVTVVVFVVVSDHLLVSQNRELSDFSSSLSLTTFNPSTSIDFYFINSCQVL